MRALLIILLFVLSGLPGYPAHAMLPCAQELQITESFANGASWQMCRQNTERENLVLSEISYRAPAGEYYQVMGSMQLSQLHVTYDDGNLTYNDVTQYGLGGEFMSTLSAADCPGGQLLAVNGRAGICLTYQRHTAAADQFRGAQQTASAESFTLSSVSQVGSYTYTASWQFFADGSMRPGIGAAGALQRSSNNPDSPFGRQLEGVADKSWLSHTHNYYWRLDFDLGEHADDDYVREHSVRAKASGRQHREQQTLEAEAARATAPRLFRSWEVVDGGSAQLPAQQTAYSLEPIEQGHRHVRAEREPFTQYDFFVTRQNDCERFASQNARFNPGCADNVLEYVNDESLQNTDIVVWHRVSFHHVPRNEDQQIMHSHWDGFFLRPRYLHQRTAGYVGQAQGLEPVFRVLSDQRHRLGAQLGLAVLSSSLDPQQFVLTGSGLPPGIALGEDGVLSGSADAAGLYSVELSASDNTRQDTATFQWAIVGRSGSGSPGLLVLLLLALQALLRQMSHRPNLRPDHRHS